jgi:DNA repair protein RecO (recombination protein O)
MTRPRNYQTVAIIIRKTKLGEADRILTIYTPHLGKIQGFAKGVRRTKSKLSGHLELLTYSQVSLARGHNIDTITGSQTIKSFFKLKSDLNLSSCALYATELVNQFTADHIENEPLFRLLLHTFERLEEGNDNELVLRYFELHLLERVGYRPQLKVCVSCQSALETTDNTFCASAGGSLCLECRLKHPTGHPTSVNTIKVLRFLQDNDFGDARRLRIDARLHSEVTAVIRDYLKYLLERDVKSAAWLDQLHGEARQDHTALL